MLIKRPTIFLAVLLLAVLTLVPVRAQDNNVPPSVDVIHAVLQDASRLSGQTLTLDNLQWHFVTFKTTALDCSGGRERAFPAQLYGYDLTVLWSGGKLDYRARALADRLFQCTGNGPGPDTKIIHAPTSLLPASEAPIPPNVIERGTPPPLEHGPLVRHELQRFGLGTLDAATYRPDGTVLAVGGSMGVWLLADDLRPIAHLVGSSQKVTSLAWRPDGKQLATTEYENAVQLWDIDTGIAHTLEQIPLTDGATNYDGSVSYSPDGSRLASASPDGVVKLWDTADGSLRSTIRVDGDVYAIAWNQDGKRLAVGGAIKAATENTTDKPSVGVYDVATGKLLSALKPEDDGHGGYVLLAPIQGLRWFRDGKRLFLIAANTQLASWNPDTGETGYYDVLAPCGTIITGIFVSSDDGHYAIALESCESTAAGAEIEATGEVTSGPGGELNLDAGYGAIRAMAWHPDGVHLAVVRGTSGVALHDITRAETTWLSVPVLQKFEVVGKVTDPDDHTAAANAMGFGMMDPEWQVIDPSLFEQSRLNADGTMVAAFDTRLKQIVVLDAHTGEKLKTLEGPPTTRKGQDYEFYSYRWSGDSSRLVGSGAATDTIVWDVRSGKIMLDLKRPLYCQFGAENSQLICVDASGSSTDDRPVVVLDATTGRQLRTLIDKFNGSITWGPQQRWLVLVGIDRHIRIWNRTLDKQLQDIPGAAVQWTPDGSRLLAFREDGTATLYNAMADRVVAVLHGTGGPLVWIYGGLTYTVAFSPDGTRFVTVDLSGEMDLWDSHTGQKLLRLVGHRGPLASLPMWSEDGRRITSKGTDGTVRVWSVS